MATSVSKAKALIEMVRAFDAQEEKRARKIGTVISNSIQKDWKNQMYSEYIELDRDAKRLFPQKIRSYSRNSEERESQRNSIEVKTEQGTYVIEISKKVKIIKEGYK